MRLNVPCAPDRVTRHFLSHVRRSGAGGRMATQPVAGGPAGHRHGLGDGAVWLANWDAALPATGAGPVGLDPTTVVSPAAISEKPPDSWLSRSKDTIEAGTFDISPVETGASLGAGARNAVTRGPSLLTKWVFCQKSGSLAA